MKRRTFITTAGAILATASLPLACAPVDTESNPAALSLIWAPETIIDIGRKYRALVPDEDGKRTLANLLSDGDTTEGEARAKADFMEGRQVWVDGWLLSVTEARQCALYSLSQPTS